MHQIMPFTEDNSRPCFVPSLTQAQLLCSILLGQEIPFCVEYIPDTGEYKFVVEVTHWEILPGWVSV